MIKFRDYIITSDSYNYIVRKRKGEKQWTTVGFYSNLKQAVEAIYQTLEKAELKQLILDLNKTESLELQKTTFFKKLDKVKNEIMEALNA
ncbi:hypothetical protein IKE84_02185 [Candidatus Saccharibacteria bacterium]|nr:hypothetical protein [Candidatus Saccharibacteria bacterium]